MRQSPRLNNVDSVLHKRVTRKNDLDLYVHVRVRVDGCALTGNIYSYRVKEHNKNLYQKQVSKVTLHFV